MKTSLVSECGHNFSSQIGFEKKTWKKSKCKGKKVNKLRFTEDNLFLEELENEWSEMVHYMDMLLKNNLFLFEN